MSKVSPELPFSEKRPWGEFRQFTDGEAVTVKTIFVQRGESFSLQDHQARSEFWRVLSGTPEITVGRAIVRAKKGDEFSVPIGVEHRVRALDDDVELLEISRGQFDEQDIVRLEDKYGRAGN